MKTIKTTRPDVGHDIRTLRNDELDAVAGAGMLSGAVSNVVKSIGNAVNTTARAG
jgi:hypothetical protein